MNRLKKTVGTVSAMILVTAGLTAPANATPVATPKKPVCTADATKNQICNPDGKVVTKLPSPKGVQVAPAGMSAKTAAAKKLPVKGMPKEGQISTLATCGPPQCYTYAGGRQGGATPMVTGYQAGMTGRMRIGGHTGTLNTSESSHTLMEVAVQGGPSNRNIVEIGVTVDVLLNGTTNPRLFVFHWVHDDPGCYNGCGFVPVSGSSWVPGVTNLTPGAEYIYDVWYEASSNNWWLGWGQVGGATPQWIGYFPEGLWSNPAAGAPGSDQAPGANPFTQMDYMQIFGEIAGNYDTPCTDMGNGIIANNTTSARFTNTAFRSPAFPATVTGVNVGTFRVPSTKVVSPYFNTYSFGPAGAQRSFGLGGPGYKGVGGTGTGAGVIGNPC